MLTQTSSEPAALDRQRRRRAAGLGVAHVEPGGERRRAELARRGLGGVGIDVGQVDGEPARRQRSGDLQAQAPSRACDQRRFHGRGAYVVRLRISGRLQNTNIRITVC